MLPVLRGSTSPEQWPFTVIVAIGKPGSEEVLTVAARRFQAELEARGAQLQVAVVNPAR